MTDYLQPIGPKGRRYALIAALTATLFFAAGIFILIAAMTPNAPRFNGGKPLWPAIGTLALLASVSGWLSLRLWLGHSANGVTLMPVWFIETCGAVFMLAILFSLLDGGWHWMVPGGISIPTAMLLIRRQVRRRSREQAQESLETEKKGSVLIWRF